jgi:hypothetical protein
MFRFRPFLFFFLSERFRWRIHVLFYKDCRRTHTPGCTSECSREQLYRTRIQQGWRRAARRLVSLFVASCTVFQPSSHTLGVIITDHEYPVRPAFSLLSKLLDDFTAKVPQSSFSNPSAISFSEINTYLQKYQDPRHADNIMRVQQELDETKIVLVRMPFFRNDLLTLIHDGRSIRQSSQFCNVARS